MVDIDRVRNSLSGAAFVAAGCVMAVLIVAVMIRLDLGTMRSFGFLLALAAGVALLIVPIERLPALALIAFAVVPASLVPTALVGRAFTPGTLVLAVWAVRVIMTRRPLRVPHPAVLWCSIGLVVWSAAVSYLSAVPTTSLAWTISIGFAIVVPVLFATPNETRELARTWLALGATLSIYAAIEAVIGRNVLFGALTGDTDVQHWSVYRAYASFGHPLLAGSFFVATFGLALGMWLTGTKRTGLLFTAVVSLIATFATISRGAIVSSVVVIALLLLLLLIRRGAGLPRVLGALAIVTAAAFAAVNTPRVVERLFSVEATRSNDARRSGIDVALSGAERYDWLGAGPAMSQRAVSGINYSAVQIESSYLQLLITVGIPGLLLLVTACALAGIAAVRAHQLGSFAALVGVAVSIGFYNAIDARWASHVLIGLTLAMCIHHVTEKRTDEPVTADKTPAKPFVSTLDSAVSGGLRGRT